MRPQHVKRQNEAGARGDPKRLPPDIHIYTTSKQPWVTLPPGAPAVPEYYRVKDTWPKENLERRAALLAARPRQ